ncbi:MAG TPA: glycoside hydrolase family 2 [Mobilitalea sp.]|nr:glycoside hydrolase family 2 [Mobilitalea sp.]
MKLRDAVRTLLSKKTVMSDQQLYTIWGERFNSEHVLEEYPRPQLKRDNYTSLNGVWNYNITKEAFKPPYYDGKIVVPFSPESVLSGVNRQLKPGEVLYYERPLITMTKQKGKLCILHFGAVDQFCEVFINARKVVEHMGGYLPFSVDITEVLEEGGNLLSVRVTDSSETSYHSRGKQRLTRGGMFYTAQSGIWQPVWLEWVPELYITFLKITPEYDDSRVKIEVQLNKTFNNSKGKELTYRFDIFENRRLVSSTSSRQSVNFIPIKNVISWSPENPFLYNMVITVGEDRVESYFAMRKFDVQLDTMKHPRLCLNNKPYYQNGLLDQGYWPDGLYTAPSDEALIFDIEQAKALGFNMLRKHIKIEPLRWYYHCDRIGMIVWQDMVNGGEKYNQLLVGYLPTIFPGIASRIKDKHYRWFGRSEEAGRLEWTRECMETVRHLYNQPCIGVWVPFNEGWGQFDAIKAVEQIREYDNTRLIDHASGWYDQSGGDFESKHNYFHPLRLDISERAAALSEFGGYACYISEHSYSLSVYGYRIYPNKEELNKAYQKLYREDIEGLKEKGLSASVYTQLSDVEDEVNGLFTYDRRVCKVMKQETGD